ncbi:hypothetical protein L227DRAFT_127587 [Lentinus tigrinus ALCF2SS1-6]|uniref:Uncharacterized protein n=1 Tax=Lentinus tigrinus ALCF2SS1-6 TaxID=1328759 RepID=A0A5C2SQ91_9APHY|nr:hypothetical protein L227DRAFT_127587 [Lentinus tigrinus ALCF2SS1-6]
MISKRRRAVRVQQVGAGLVKCFREQDRLQARANESNYATSTLAPPASIIVEWKYLPSRNVLGQTTAFTDLVRSEHAVVHLVSRSGPHRVLVFRILAGVRVRCSRSLRQGMRTEYWRGDGAYRCEVSGRSLLCRCVSLGIYPSSTCARIHRYATLCAVARRTVPPRSISGQRFGGRTTSIAICGRARIPPLSLGISGWTTPRRGCAEGSSCAWAEVSSREKGRSGSVLSNMKAARNDKHAVKGSFDR